MSTTDLQGTVSTASGSPTVVVIANGPTHLQAVFDDSSGGGTVRVAVNAEGLNQTLNSAIPCNGIASPILSASGIGSLTLVASTANTKYWLHPFKRS